MFAGTGSTDRSNRAHSLPSWLAGVPMSHIEADVVAMEIVVEKRLDARRAENAFVLVEGPLDERAMLGNRELWDDAARLVDVCARNVARRTERERLVDGDRAMDFREELRHVACDRSSTRPLE